MHGGAQVFLDLPLVPGVQHRVLEPHRHDPSDPIDVEDTEGSGPPAAPGWVKLLGVGVGLLVVVIVVKMLVGGGHGPGCTASTAGSRAACRSLLPLVPVRPAAGATASGRSQGVAGRPRRVVGGLAGGGGSVPGAGRRGGPVVRRAVDPGAVRGHGRHGPGRARAAQPGLAHLSSRPVPRHLVGPAAALVGDRQAGHHRARHGGPAAVHRHAAPARRRRAQPVARRRPHPAAELLASAISRRRRGAPRRRCPVGLQAQRPDRLRLAPPLGADCPGSTW